MDRNWPSIIKINQQRLFAYVVLVLVLVGSCPIKASIKSLIGIPVNTEQSAPKSTHAFQVSGTDKCAAVQTNEVKIFQTNSSSASGLLPVAFFIFAFICALGFPLTKEQLHPSYGNLKIPAALPVFLQHRRLII